MIKNARLAIIGLITAALALFGATLFASAAPDVEPSLVLGNPSCDGGIKIEPVNSGTYADGKITIVVNAAAKTFDFTTNDFVVTSVVVKGGPNANVYTYPAPGVTADDGLHAPVKGSGYYGLSHLCFFGEDEKTPPSSSTAPPPTK